MTDSNAPRPLPGCSTLAPMPSPNGSRHRHQGDQDNEKTKGKTARRKAADRFRCLNNFVDFMLAELTRNEIAVWLVLYRDTKPDGTARTSQVDLARRAGMSARTVRRALARLQDRGLLKLAYRGGIGRGASAYRVRALSPDR